MDIEMAARLHTLAEEYVSYVEMMRGGQYADMTEYQRLSADRTLVHDELLRILDKDRSFDMYRHCKALLAP